MKNLYDVLAQKEHQLQQLQKEVEALRLAARILSEQESGTSSAAVSAPPQAVDAYRKPDAAAAGFAPAREMAHKQFP